MVARWLCVGARTHTRARVRVCIYLFLEKRHARFRHEISGEESTDGRTVGSFGVESTYSNERSTDKITFHSSWIILLSPRGLCRAFMRIVITWNVPKIH